MPFVLDASVTLNWAFEEEEHPHAELALQRLRNEPAWAPSIWWYEVRNSLIVNERRNRITAGATAAFLRDLARLSVLVDQALQEADVLSLARRHELTVYDAAYLELAKRTGMPLATLDRALVGAARAETVPVIGVDL